MWELTNEKPVKRNCAVNAAFPPNGESGVNWNPDPDCGTRFKKKLDTFKLRQLTRLAPLRVQTLGWLRGSAAPAAHIYALKNDPGSLRRGLVPLTLAWKWIPCWYASSLWSGTLESATSSTRLYLFLAGITETGETDRRRWSFGSTRRRCPGADRASPVRDSRASPAVSWRRGRSPLLLPWASKRSDPLKGGWGWGGGDVCEPPSLFPRDNPSFTSWSAVGNVAHSGVKREISRRCCCTFSLLPPVLSGVARPLGCLPPLDLPPPGLPPPQSRKQSRHWSKVTVHDATGSREREARPRHPSFSSDVISDSCPGIFFLKNVNEIFLIGIQVTSCTELIFKSILSIVGHCRNAR